MPEEYFILSINNSLEKIKPFIETLRCLSDAGVDKNGIHMSTSVQELKSQLIKVSDDIPKLIIIDDFCTSKMPPELMQIINESVHHHYAFCVVTVQGFFIRDGPALRTAADYLVIFPGNAEQKLNLFLRDLPKGAAEVVTSHLSMANQKRQDGLEDDYVYIRTPAIIDRSFNRSGITVWRGLHDRDPYVEDESGATSSNALVDYIESKK